MRRTGPLGTLPGGLWSTDLGGLLMSYRCIGTCRNCGRPLMNDWTIYHPQPVGPDGKRELCFRCGDLEDTNWFRNSRDS
jgi:hypothetical protein